MASEPSESMLGKWNYGFKKAFPFIKRRFPYGDTLSYRKAAEFLDGFGDVEDWGCGTAYAKRYFRTSSYRGIDGSRGYATIIADLRTYRSVIPCLLMRHILEHNRDWRLVLDNALQSFQNRMVLVLFTPFVPETRELSVNSNNIPNIGFKKEDVTSLFQGIRYIEESLHTNTEYGSEHIFYLSKFQP